MIENESLDLLMIGSPNHLHLEHIKEGLNSGLKIFAEKPVVINEPQTYELANLVKKSLARIDIFAKIKKVSNPRIEKEKHYYNAKHSNIKKLGLKPLKLDKNIIIDIAEYVSRHKNNINTKIIQPRVNW